MNEPESVSGSFQLPPYCTLHSHDCLCGVEAELILWALLTASAASVVMKWFSLRTPPLMAPQVLPGASGRAKLSSRFLTQLSGNKLATKSFFSQFRPLDQADVHSSGGDKISPFLRGGSRIHLMKARELAQRHFEFCSAFSGSEHAGWDMRGQEVLQRMLTNFNETCG